MVKLTKLSNVFQSRKGGVDEMISQLKFILRNKEHNRMSRLKSQTFIESTASGSDNSRQDKKRKTLIGTTDSASIFT